jgi:hypothetical protein
MIVYKVDRTYNYYLEFYKNFNHKALKTILSVANKVKNKHIYNKSYNGFLDNKITAIENTLKGLNK